MAITNAQQYKQLVNPPLDGKRPGYRGDAAYASKSEQSAKSVGGQGQTAAERGDPPGSTRDYGENYGSTPNTDTGTTKGNIVTYDPDEALATAKAQGAFDKPNFFESLITARKKPIYNIFPNNPKTELRFISRLKNFNPEIYNRLPKNIKDLYEETIAYDEDRSFKDFDKFSFDDFEALGKFKTGLDTPGLENFAEYAATYGGAPGLKYSGDVGNLEKYVTGKDPITGETMYGYKERRDDGGGDGGMSDYERRLLELEKQLKDQQAAAPTTTQNPFAYRFFADGGSTGGIMDADFVGGMMDVNMDDMGRQMYGLGKLVKSVTRGIKKVAKSPIGKAVLLNFAPALIPGGASTFFGGSKAMFGLPSFLSKKGLSDFFLKEGAKKFTLGNLSQRGLLTGLAGISALPFLFKGEEEEEQDLYRGPSIDIPRIRNNPYAFTAPRFEGSQFAADGGRIGYDTAGAVMSEEDMKKLAKSPLYKGFKKLYGADPSMAKDNPAYDEKFDTFEKLYKEGFQKGGNVEPVAKKTMPLIDMDGMEKDYRETGGFVEMGRMERADDVPARLSKNEFVFTADAVRNAGEGDIDKGAEVMYNMMKNLESGGEVSEESQGLEGARKMFQTSQRLGEVI